jgi:hypothetical protein
MSSGEALQALGVAAADSNHEQAERIHRQIHFTEGD